MAIFGLHRQLHAVVLTRTRSWQCRLGTMPEVEQLGMRVNADFDVLAMDLVPRALRASARNSLAKGLRALDELMLAPLDLPAGPIVLLPPGKFAGLPWGALPSFAGRPLTVAPSAAAWLRAHAPTSTAIPARWWRSPDPASTGPIRKSPRWRRPGPAV